MDADLAQWQSAPLWTGKCRFNSSSRCQFLGGLQAKSAPGARARSTGHGPGHEGATRHPGRAVPDKIRAPRLLSRMGRWNVGSVQELGILQRGSRDADHGRPAIGIRLFGARNAVPACGLRAVKRGIGILQQRT
jgi:hypothetical protein